MHPIFDPNYLSRLSQALKGSAPQSQSHLRNEDSQSGTTWKSKSTGFSVVVKNVSGILPVSEKLAQEYMYGYKFLMNKAHSTHKRYQLIGRSVADMRSQCSSRTVQREARLSQGVEFGVFCDFTVANRNNGDKFMPL